MRLVGMCALLLLARLEPVRPAHAASKHEVFLQHAWHRFEENGDWSDWEETWRRHDHDKDGNIRVNVGEITRLFTEHYNILHDRLGHDEKPGLTSIGHGRAGDPTFVREAQAFIKLREEMTGSTHKNTPMSWKEFHKEMTVFMEHQKGGQDADLHAKAPVKHMHAVHDTVNHRLAMYEAQLPLLKHLP